MKLYSRLMNFLYPPKCVLCQKILDKDETDLCKQCRLEAPECPILPAKFSFLDSWTAVWYYEDPVRGSVLRYKFSNARHYAACYGRLLAMKLQERFPDGFDCITWVPVSRLRRFRRGYDQVELLAKAVGKELGIKPLRLLKKIRHNPPQSGIGDAAHRRANVMGVYQAVNPARFAGKRILLLDDIITTGATASECARVLLTAGAKEVICAAIAAANHQQKNQ